MCLIRDLQGEKIKKERKYTGMHLRWDCKHKKVHLVMPGYAKQIMKEFQYEHPRYR